MEEQRSKKIDFRFFVVCFLDLLGQEERLLEWADFPSDRAEYERFVNGVKKSYGTVIKFRRLFEQFFQAADKYRPCLDGFLAEVQASFNRSEAKLTTEQFSDTFVFYAPLGDIDTGLDLRPLYKVLYASKMALLFALAGKTAMRGGITVGMGREICAGNFYGPALAEAHLLESRLAQWPRVVISSRVWKLLCLSKYSDSPPFNSLMIGLREECFRLLHTDDTDGQIMVDFAGSSGRNGPDVSEELNSAYQFCSAEQKRFDESGCDKLAARYAAAVRYMQARLH